MTKRKKRFLLIGGPLVAVAVASPFIASSIVLRTTSERIYLTTEAVPQRRVALVLGTAPLIQGRKNLYFEARMNAAAKLYASGKVEKLLVSGDKLAGWL
jgi:SanA protein